MTIKYAMFNPDPYFDEVSDAMTERYTVVPAEDIDKLVDLSEQRVVLLRGLSQEEAQRVIDECKDELAQWRYDEDKLAVIKERHPQATMADDTEKCEDVPCYDLTGEILYNLLDCDAHPVYEYWDGGNWRKSWIEERDIDEVEVEEAPESLDTWDGSNLCYRQRFVHGRLYRILTIDGEKPERSLWLLYEYSDYQGSVPWGRIVDATERYEILKYADVEGYFSTSEAAEVLDVTEARIRALCQRGRMGRKVGGRWVISVEDIERNRERKPGRPAKAE